MPSGAKDNLEHPTSPKTLTLQEELKSVLSQDVLSFTGDYYHAGIQLSAPNPCLSISGLGPVGLPLVEDYARRVISCSNSAYTEATIPTATWEIEPAQISFLNPAWSTYISKTLCQEVCTGLGVLTPAKMELGKLLLYEAGTSYSTPPSGSQKENGIFATALVFLPSAYTGGEITLSYASKNTTINFSAESGYASAVVATYGDVAHEIGPISSGYCLALSYNLIHAPSPNAARPSPPAIVQATSVLRTIFAKWKHALETHTSEQYLMALLLEQTYDFKSSQNLVSALEGVDAYRVRILRDLGEELGFTLGFGCLELESGEDLNVLRRRPTGLGMNHLTGLDGMPLFGLTKALTLPKGTVIMVPAAPSKTSRQDKVCCGRSKTGSKHFVLLLIDQNHHDDVRFEVEGLPVAVQVLRETSRIPPTQANLKWARRVLPKKSDSYHMHKEEYTPEMLRDILNYSMDWEDISLWKQATDAYKWRFKNVGSDILFRAYRTFPFDQIRDSFNDAIVRDSDWSSHSPDLPLEIIMFLQTLSAEAEKGDEKESVQRWCEGAINSALSGCSYPPTGPQYAHNILRLIQLVGVKRCMRHLFVNLIDRDDKRYFRFWMALHVLLREQRQSLLEELSISHPEPEAPATPNSEDADTPNDLKSTAGILNAMIKVSLEIPSLVWFEEERPRDYSFLGYTIPTSHVTFNPIPGRIDRLLLLLDACVRAGDTEICEAVLSKALDMPGNLMWYCAEFYTPVISRLPDILAPLNQDVSQPPFANFLRKLIGRYLSKVLGKRGPVVDIGLRKVSCDQPKCDVCKKLDAFILSTQSVLQLRVDNKEYFHIYRRLEQAIDLCTSSQLTKALDGFSSHVRGCTIEIKKHESVMQCSSWDYRLSATKAFLTSIGSDSVIEDIMGERYADVQSALDGRRKFVWDEKRDTQAQLAVISPAVDDPAVSDPAPSTPAQPRQARRSQKRKRA